MVLEKWLKVFPWQVRLLVAGVAVTAGLLTLHNLNKMGPIDLRQLAAIVVFGGLAAVSLFRPSWSFNQQATYSTVVAAYFSLAMVLPRAWIAPVILASWLPLVVLRMRTKPTWPVEAAFNASVDIIAAVMARDLYHAVSGYMPFPTLSILVAALAFFGVQTLLVTTVVKMYRRIPLREVDTLKVASLSADLIMVLVGGVTALLYHLDPMSLVLVFLPLGYLQHLMERVQSEKAAYVDPKTGLFNYKYLDERLPKELDRARSTGMPISLIFADLDFLREINNNYGHLAGDVAIRHVGKVLEGSIQNNQFVARFGGEEYMLVLPQTDHDEALRLAELARVQVSETAIEYGSHTFRVTMSFGVATVPDHAWTVRDLIHAADMAVYQAKANGRNCVCSYRKEGTEPCAASR